MDLDDRARFEQIVLPHLDAAFNLARWMLRSRADAEDVAQEALLSVPTASSAASTEAMPVHGCCRIVRNTCYTWLQKNHPAGNYGGI